MNWAIVTRAHVPRQVETVAYQTKSLQAYSWVVNYVNTRKLGIFQEELAIARQMTELLAQKVQKLASEAEAANAD